MTKKRVDDDHELDFSPEELAQLTKLTLPPKTMAELTKTMNPSEFIEKLMARINCQGDEHYRTLAPLSQLATAINAFMLETGSGGIGQFLLNSDTNLVDDCREYLPVIGAVKASEILERALALFPKGKIPANKKERIRLMMAFEKKGPGDPFRPLERAMWRNKEDLARLLRKYVVKHKRKLSEETGLV